MPFAARWSCLRPRWTIALLYAAALPAATVRGIVLDHFTGRPLARALVTMVGIPGSPSAALSIRTNSLGQFTFATVSRGGYLFQASRTGWSTLKYGQKAWDAPAPPVMIEQNDELFLQFRLQRLGAITGVVWDENEIGLAEQKVVAYTDTRPPHLAGEAKTDDRGAYRISGLTPGNYFVRSGPAELEDGSGLVPTFYKEVVTVEEARTVEVDLDRQAEDISFRPTAGKLVRIRGRVLSPFYPVRLQLVSDMGRLGGSTDGSGNFEFVRQSPGTYELFGSAEGPRQQLWAGYRRFSVERDEDNTWFDIHPLGTMEMRYSDQAGNPVDPSGITVFVRRKDLAGVGEPLKLDRNTRLTAGRWELLVIPPPSYYPVSLSTGGRSEMQSGRADEWKEILVPPGFPVLLIAVKLSSRPASLRGKVNVSSSDPAIGAPVYLEPFDPDTARRLGEVRVTRTDLRGQYHFTGLPPGTYRVLSSFEFEDPDEQALTAGRAVTLSLDESRETLRDVELYVR